MDRNTAIGMTLMGALLLAYFYFFPGIAAQRAVVGEFVFSAEPYAGLEGIQQAQALAH